MPTQYSRGRAFEYKVVKYLKDSGNYDLVVRSAGSHSAADIIAVDPWRDRVLLVSCKKAAYWPKEELEALKRLRSNHVLVSKAYLNKYGKLEFDGV